MGDKRTTVSIYITDCEEGGNLLNKALKVYLTNLSKNDEFNHLKIYDEQDSIKEDNGKRLVVITNLNPVGSEIILNKIYSMVEQKVFGEEHKTPFHLVCLTDEKETLLHKLFNKDKKYKNENIGSSLLLLKYMDSVRALTFWNVFSDKFTAQVKDFFEPQENGDRIFEQKCSLEGFDKLLKICDETNKKITGKDLIETAKEIDGSFNAKVESSTLSYLARLYKNSKTGNLNLGGHGFRRDFYNPFSIPMNKDIDKRNNDIAKNTKRMMFMFFARDWARNIADNVWNRVKEYNKEINILIIDDQPQYFCEEIKQLCKCFPNGKVKFYIIKDYKVFIDQLNHFGNDEEKMNYEVDCYDYCETKTCNPKMSKSNVLLKNFSFVFIDLLLGTENLGFDIIKSLSRLKIEENEKNELKYDIFVLSLSTNTNDIQTALNKGAIGYIFKERIFSIPYRICEVLLEPGKKEHDLLYYISPFSGLNRLPLKIIRKLKSSPFENTEENRKWIKKIPKADLHCHIGGAMDAEITLELAVNIFRDTIRAYLLTKSFIYLENDSNKQKTSRSKINNFCRDKNVSKSLSLTDRAAKKLNEELINNQPTSLKKHIQWIASNVSSIKKHQVICFILIQFAVQIKQEFKDLNNEAKTFTKIEEFALEVLNNNVLKPKGINGKFNKLIEAPCENEDNKRKCGGQGLPSFLTGGLFTGSAVLQTKENLEKAADYIYERSKKENVIYRELKITPSGFTQGNLTENNVINIFKERFNENNKKDKENDKNDKKNDIPPLINIIIAGKRHGETKALNRNISLVLRDSMEDKEYKFEDKNKIETRICGFDLVGEEMYYDPRLFRDSFRGLFEACTPLTIHAGEETDVNKIWEAVYELNADRIGHGLSLVKTNENAKGLLSRFRDHKVCIELCPKSNFLTKGFRLPSVDATKEFQPYPLKYFLENKMQVTINTDDPAFSGSFYNSEDEDFKNAELSQEYLLATELFKASFKKNDKNSRHLTQWEVLKLIKMGFKHAFLDINIKRELMRIADEKIYDIIIKNDKMD